MSRIKRFQHFLHRKNVLVGVFFLFTACIVAGWFVWSTKFWIPDNRTLNLNQEQIASKALSIETKCWTDQSCFGEELAKETLTYGITTGQAILEKIQDRNEQTKNCHVIAHSMSEEAYSRNPRDFFKLIDTVDVVACGSGFLHGVLEGYTGDHPDIPIDANFTNKICGERKDEYRQRMCVHFMGHIVLLNNLGDLKKSLPFCTTLADKWKYDCYDGTYMEDHQKLILSQHGVMPEPTLDKAYFHAMESECNAQPGIIGNACWTEMAEMYLHAYGYRPEVVYEGCKHANLAEGVDACYNKGVIAISIYPGFDTAKKLVPICSYYFNDMNRFYRCTNSLIAGLMYYSPKFTPRGVIFCSNIPQKYQTACFDMLVQYLRQNTPDPKARVPFCDYIPYIYKDKNNCYQ